MKKKNLALATALLRAGVTSRSLSKKSGISETSLSLILNSRRNPKPETRKRIAAALQLSAASLWPEGGAK